MGVPACADLRRPWISAERQCRSAFHRATGRASGPRRCVVGTEIDPQCEDPVVDGRLGVGEHGEVHEVRLCLLLEPLPVWSLDRREPSGPDGIGPVPEPFYHGLRVELIGHGAMVPVGTTRYE